VTTHSPSPTRRRTARAARWVGLAVTGALGLAACGVGAPTTGGSTAPAPELAPDQKVMITFESYNLSQAGPWTDTFDQLIGEFSKEHPNITVKAQKPQGTSPNGVTNAVPSVQAQLVTGTPPDVAQLGFGDLDFVVHQLGAKPLDDLVGRPAVDAEFDGEHPFAPTARTLGDWDGKTYGIPFVFSTPVLYYNASLFAAAGLDPNRPPQTWAEVKTDAQAIKARTGKDGSYLDCLTKVSGDWCYQALVESNGGSVISDDRSRLTFADPPAVGAVAMARDLVSSGASPKLSQTQAYPEFARGDMGMLLESSSLQGTFQKGAAGKWDLRAAPMPSFDGRPTMPTNSGAALFVLSNDPAKQRAAWDLVQFLTSDQAYTAIAQKIGYLPLRTSLTTDPRYLQPWAASNPLLAPNLEQLARLQRWQSFPGNDYTRIKDTMMQGVETAVYQGADPQATMAAAQANASPLLPATK
jgi:multiple sugar transport system substrate-binding protein